MLRVFSQTRHAFAYVSIFALWVLLIFTFTDGFGASSSWLNSWMNWDSGWYEKIWAEGYPKETPGLLVFPPGYSVLVGLLSSVTRLEFKTVAFVVNVLAFFGAAVVAAELLAKELKISALVLFVLTLSSPTAYFAFTGYSDTVFMLLFWITLWVMTRTPQSARDRALEAALLFVMPWIRLTGYALASLLIVKRYKASMVFVSLATWVVFNYWLKGDAFYFLKAQQLVSMDSGSIVTGFLHAFRGLTFEFVPFSQFDIENYLEFHLLPIAYFFMLFFAGVWLWVKKHSVFGVTCLAILVMSHNQAFWRSTVRYDLPILPFAYAVVFALLYRNRGAGPALRSGFVLGMFATVQFILQIYLSRIFHSGGWAF